jgi:hypothetical protein
MNACCRADTHGPQGANGTFHLGKRKEIEPRDEDRLLHLYRRGEIS